MINYWKIFSLATIILDFLTLIISGVTFLFSFMLYDSPTASQNMTTNLVFAFLLVFPLITLLTIIFTIRNYNKTNYKTAFFLSLIPLLPVLLVIILGRIPY